MDPFREGPLREALRALFNSELASSQSVLKGYVAATPRDPLGYSLSAAAPFYHFVGSRLRPHGAGSVRDMIVGKGIGVPADIQEIAEALKTSRRLAGIDREADPRDQNALLALCIVECVERDILVLVYRRWMAGLRHAQAASVEARQLVEVNADAYDAYYVIGLSEYVLSEIPAILRPFTKIPGVIGQKSRAIQFLDAAARKGCYLQDFARQMLVSIYLEEHRPQDAVRVLEGLVKDYAGNAGFRAELERLKG
jgi:hypothetical protein